MRKPAHFSASALSMCRPPCACVRVKSRPGSKNFNFQLPLGASDSSPIRAKRKKKKLKETDLLRMCVAVPTFRVKMAERGYSFSLTTFRYPGNPRFHASQITGAPQTWSRVSDLAGVCAGARGDGAGLVALQSHVRCQAWALAEGGVEG